MPYHNRKQAIIVVQGGQWGSEGKGMVTAGLCFEKMCDYAVRTGTVNAGHTVYYKGKAYKMQQLPVGWVKPECQLVIGAGAYIHPDILAREIMEINLATGTDVRERLWIDGNAGLHLPEHTDRATEAGRHVLMGATGKGCSEAVVEKIKGRGDGKAHLFREWLLNECPDKPEYKMLNNLTFADTSQLLNDEYDAGKRIILEGTQGTHLDLHLGPYPYTTHKQTQAAQWAMECGLGLGAEYEIYLVCRTYPIRVAGNSGPMPRETSWLEVGQELRNKVMKDPGHCGRVPYFRQEDLNEWQDKVIEVGRGFGLNANESLFPYKFNENPEWAKRNEKALSELNAEVLRQYPQFLTTVGNFFETTTVTKKLRRVAKWDFDVVRKAIQWNRPSYLVISFWNYWYPELWGATEIDPKVHTDSGVSVDDILHRTGIPVSHVTTGPESKHLLISGNFGTWKSSTRIPVEG